MKTDAIPFNIFGVFGDEVLYLYFDRLKKLKDDLVVEITVNFRIAGRGVALILSI